MGPKYLSELGRVLIEMALILGIVGFFSPHIGCLHSKTDKSRLKRQGKCYCSQQQMRGSRPWTQPCRFSVDVAVCGSFMRLDLFRF